MWRRNKRKQKKVLVDLSELSNTYCGLKQVALAYGNYFKENYKRNETGYILTLLIPRKMFGKFGREVRYISSSSWFLRHCRYLFPSFDIWHATHQLSRFKPAYSRTKFILTIHDLNYLYEATGEQRERKHRRLQRKINRADEIVCISEFTKQEVGKNLVLNGKRCKVIYNGVENIVRKPALKPNREIKGHFFFTIGTVMKKKNFHVLLNMMKLMPDRHLYIAGDSSLEEYGKMIKQRIETEGIHNVTLLGTIPEEEKIWLYANCEAFLFPSLFEGFGLPVIEAMQFGKPVFSSRETCLKEIGGEFAYFWKNFDPQEMKRLIDENLEGFYQDKDLAQRQKEYAHSFSYEKHFKEYQKLYSFL
ncbi:putative glycosyl transferase 1 [Proteiniphilum saccharofermentans]|uniref:Putative glycosyl transferase 1 n=1 Tax=Proteiniphilum saccharofermentans TaxID=1642647 RepID=A0A1R3SYS6_9BACT|nr:glycosyltransferase family 1 protein [Proteiniphilum saccharofermentans]SCD21346.1 putative glycosyl transferase 1 [Proteiniphilum saccharofermentans]SDZ79680.1 Glycosyltransferase involved in cell wall bisynthesis [Porphyromonadaceae bacterium KH3R12]SFS85485.1 Glycosyltransferase involved in cell wall bisynthesis [Porphyromonadaceae bacterium NLAE-zl-C104]